MRYLMLTLSALWLIARAVAYHARRCIRRRASRVRRYAVRPAAPDPNVIRGPVPLITSLEASGSEAPPLPEQPILAWEKSQTAEPVDVLRLRRVDRRPRRTDRPRIRAAVLVVLSEQCQEQRPGRHRAVVAA